MVQNNNLSNWATSVQYGQIYEEFNENEDLLNNAYHAINQFCKKEKRRSKIAKRRKHCWQ